MPTSRDIIRFVESRAGRSIAEDEGVTFGPPTRELTGVTVCWMANPDSISATAEAGHNCVVHHEALTYPYPGYASQSDRDCHNWPINVQRMDLLSRHNLTGIRLHGILDELYVFDAFAEQLGLGEPVASGESVLPHERVYGSPVATFGELVEHVKKAMGMPAVRTTVDRPDRPVKRIGLPVGGLGLFVNVGTMQGWVDKGVDTLICGESDNYGFRFPAELGIAMIETSHELSEQRGLERFACDLQTELGIDVKSCDTPCVWRMA